MLNNILAENAVLRIINQSQKNYDSFTDIYDKASWFVDKAELLGELDRLVRCGHIRVKGIHAQLYIHITAAGIAFLAEGN